jgi:tRNA(fMet)-specific endonuclease VapC
MYRYMLDTDIFSYIMNRSSASVTRKLEGVGVGDVCLSAIVESEVLFGIERSPRRHIIQTAFDKYLKYFDVLAYPPEAAIHYAQIRAALEARGTPIGANDLFVAAHARCLGLTLVTNNTREFARVPGLKIENWA